MRRLGRWFLGFLLVIAGAVAALYGYTVFRFNRSYDVATRPLTLPTDSASLARGQHVATAIGKCVDCHTADLGGKVFIDDKALGYIVTPNLTGGPGSPVAGWTVADWDRAIRHGVGPKHRRPGHHAGRGIPVLHRRRLHGPGGLHHVGAQGGSLAARSDASARWRAAFTSLASCRSSPRKW